MKKLLLDKLTVALNNPHMSGAVIVTVGISVAMIWLPQQYEHKLAATLVILQVYGLAMNRVPSSDGLVQPVNTTPDAKNP